MRYVAPSSDPASLHPERMDPWPGGSHHRRGGAPLRALNPIAWMIGHLAWQEQAYWLQRAQGQTLVPEVDRFGFGQPPSTPGLQEVWAAWRTITAAADPYLDSLTTESLQTRWEREPTTESIGTKLLRNDLSLLVSPRRGPGRSPAPGPHGPAAIRGRYFPRALLSRIAADRSGSRDARLTSPSRPIPR